MFAASCLLLTMTPLLFAVVPEAAVRRVINALNGNLPVYKRIKTVVVRNEPFPRTASGKIRVPSTPLLASSRSEKPASTMPSGVRRPFLARRRFRIPFIIVFALAAAAIAVAALGLVPQLLDLYGVVLPGSLHVLFDYIDLASEILLGFFALIFVLRTRDREK